MCYVTNVSRIGANLIGAQNIKIGIFKKLRLSFFNTPTMGQYIMILYIIRRYHE